MKIKNIAFFGVMASIFGIAGAEAADSTPTKIATTAYVTNAVTTHADDAVKHITAEEREAWSAKQNAITTGSLNGNVLTDNTVNGSKLVSSSVALVKLDSTVQASLGKANTALQSAAIANMEVTTNKKNATTAAEWSSAVSASSAATDYPTVKAVATALSTKQGTIADGGLGGAKLTDGTVTKAKLESTVRSSLDKADSALQADSTLNGAKLSANSVAKTALSTAVQSAITAAENISTTVTNAINDLNATVNATTNQVVTGVVETNGKITSVNATLIKNANVAAAGTANIDYGKMNAAINDINGTTGWSAASDCSSTTPCVLTYIGANTYKWTVMDIPAAN